MVTPTRTFLDIQHAKRRTIEYWRKLFTWRRLLAFVLFVVEEASFGLLWKGLSIAAVWVVAFSRKPMGLGVAVLVLSLAVGSLWVAMDPGGFLSRWRAKKAALSAASRPRLNVEEKEQVQQVRAVWNRYGASAAYLLGNLFDAAVPRDPPKEFWMVLLRPLRERLDETRLALAEAVDDKSVMPFVEVQQRLNNFCGAYFKLGKWLALLNANSISLTAEPYRSDLEKWLRANVAFRRQLEENLHERPEHRGALKIFLIHDEGVVVRFLNAETVADMVRPPPSA
jgi:hypothetical protein